jgi:hypothetical protein
MKDEEILHFLDDIEQSKTTPSEFLQKFTSDEEYIASPLEFVEKFLCLLWIKGSQVSSFES